MDIPTGHNLTAEVIMVDNVMLDQVQAEQYFLVQYIYLLHFVAFFHVASLSIEVDNEKVGVDNEKALNLDIRIFSFIFQLDFSIHCKYIQWKDSGSTVKPLSFLKNTVVYHLPCHSCWP